MLLKPDYLFLQHNLQGAAISMNFSAPVVGSPVGVDSFGSWIEESGHLVYSYFNAINPALFSAFSIVARLILGWS